MLVCIDFIRDTVTNLKQQAKDREELDMTTGEEVSQFILLFFSINLNESEVKC